MPDITKADLAAWRVLSIPLSQPETAARKQLAECKWALCQAIEEIERVTRDRDSYARSDFERQLDDARTRISTLERLCREAKITIAAWEAPDNPENMRLALSAISAILAAVEGES